MTRANIRNLIAGLNRQSIIYNQIDIFSYELRHFKGSLTTKGF